MAMGHDSQTTKATRAFKALSVEARVRMVELLKSRALCVNALARELKITAAAVSQHLRVLRDCDLVVPDKRGNFVHYRVNEATLADWREQANRLLGPPEA
jgi:DNA-binding transcriptional ArsR family regulator